MTRLFMSLLAMLVVAAVPARAQERPAEQLRKGIVEEEASQNLDKAIQSYQAIVARYDEDRKVAGTAMFRLAECYRKAGKREQAIAAYQRVVREFGDQTGISDPSRQQLASLGASEALAVRPSTRSGRTEGRPSEAATRRPREVAPTRDETPHEVAPEGPKPSTERRFGSLEASRIEMEAARARLADTQTRFEMGQATQADVQAAQTQVKLIEERMRQQAMERELTQRMAASVQAEIKLVQDRVNELEQSVKRGIVPFDDPRLLQLRRDLLSLQRKLDELRLNLKR